jgi:hypothetical protein
MVVGVFVSSSLASYDLPFLHRASAIHDSTQVDPRGLSRFVSVRFVVDLRRRAARYVCPCHSIPSARAPAGLQKVKPPTHKTGA